MSLFGQEKRDNIEDLINIEIRLDNGFAGESLTLEKANGKYIVKRKVCGSGMPIVATIEYEVNQLSLSQIEFEKIIGTTNEEITNSNTDHFKMNVQDGIVSVYLNGLKLVTK